ncbi:MAG: hypothetical protein IJG36_05615 [Synergistaceae bacterium]|nr:hypothetical protein [Synergistaceae bacterium]MBQ3586412.1 hypothetical protein [Synergistaceae bacterium]MBQ6002681.1 hypothetical protein [Synergistaceae bacterium]MBR0167524.1 hypothetical protein [Synergistaceae bacterium]MBR0278441.1 hypothetical protein [Synergistaceae bacterium]
MATVTLTIEDSFYSPANMERLRKSIAQLEAGEGKEHELIEADLRQITQNELS